MVFTNRYIPLDPIISQSVTRMADLYSNHPSVSFSLRQFSEYAFELFKDEPVADPYVRFVLTGEYTDADDGQTKQVFVDPIQNVVNADHPLSISRDYDSVLGISHKIMVKAPITVFSTPHPSYALKSSIHIKHPIMYNDVSPCCLIPFPFPFLPASIIEGGIH